MKTAKDLFWDFACNHFFLDRDGMMAEYIKLGGNDPAKEQLWRKEYIDYWLSKIDEEDLLVFRKLSDAHAIESLTDFMKFNNFRDDYVKFWYAYTLLDFSKSKPSNREAREKALNLLRTIASAKIVIKPENNKSISKEMMNAFDAKSKEEYIKNYSIRLLKSMK